MRVAVLGTGIMGGPIARNLAGAGHDVAAWNRTPEKAAPLAGDGIRVAGSAGDAADGADVVLTMLLDASATGRVLREASPASGSAWLQMATVGIDGTETLAELAHDRGLVFWDAPVLGSKAQAESGALTVLASGPDEARERVEPLIQAVGERIFWLGPAGAGNRTKLVLNHWVLCSMEAIAETIALAEGIDVDPGRVLEIVSGGGMDMPYLQLKGGMIAKRELAPAFRLDVALKDLGLIQEAGKEAGLDLALVEAALAKFERAIELGHGGEDMAATYYATAPASGG